MSSDRHRPFTQVLLGRPLETSEAHLQAIGKLPALAVFASDALSSVAYATEEVLVVLALAGAGALPLSMPIAVAIGLLLVVVTISYRQTIFAYPGGGGAYTVARDNLGEKAGLVAAAALMTDYTLTVAVSISSGMAQVASAVPGLREFRVELAVALILGITLLNLRGARESSAILSIPTYYFLVMAFLMVGAGLVRWIGGSLGTVSRVEVIEAAVQPLSVFIILRAFSSGSTAMTGIEAISNGITAFKEPRARNAATTLGVMSLVLLTLFLGVTFLANQVGALPSHSETVISQLARTVFGEGVLYLLVLAATTGILIMAANTSFADFPRLGALLAGDGYLPRQLTLRGSRLVFSWGIAGLAGVACALVIVFDASVSALIPLYAVGVFLSFTLSQTGMVLRWRRMAGSARAGGEGTAARLAVNAAGAAATGVVTIVFAVTKFRDGAWVIVLLIPVLTLTFARVRRHYREVAHDLSLAVAARPKSPRPTRTLVLVDRLHASTLRMIQFVGSLGIPWTAVHVSVDEARTEELRAKWVERFADRELVVLPSPYRSLTEPLLDYLRRQRQEDPEAYLHVILGGLVTESFWEQALHENSSLVVELALRQIEGVAVTSVPFHLHHLPADDHETASK